MRTPRAGLGGQDLERGRPGMCVEGMWWSAYGEPLAANSPELSLIPTRPPSMGGALAPLVLSANCAHQRVWEVGWGQAPLDLCGVLVRDLELLGWPWLAGGLTLV